MDIAEYTSQLLDIDDANRTFYTVIISLMPRDIGRQKYWEILHDICRNETSSRLQVDQKVSEQQEYSTHIRKQYDC